MALAQVAQGHQEALDELLKLAQNEADAKVASNAQEEIRVQGALRNDVISGPLNLHTVHNWSGNTNNFPGILKSNAIHFFHQVSKAEIGIKSAVVYSGKNNSGLHQCGWLVAWSNPKDALAKKIYAECGPIEKYENINWADIQVKLNNSGDESNYYDPVSGTSVASRIRSMQMFPSSDGFLAAVFKG